MGFGDEHPEYSLLQRCASECISTFMAVFLVETILANKLLPNTKGHDVGFGWVAFGIGFAFFLPLQYFGFISTAVNPAMTFASAIVGDIPWHYFPAIAASQLLGAFTGAVLVWVYYLPHFSTCPEPPPAKKEYRLLRTRDDIGASALRFASYNTNPAQFSIRRSISRRERPERRHRAYRDEDVLGHDAVAGRDGMNRRRSVSIADLHERLGRLEQMSGSFRRRLSVGGGSGRIKPRVDKKGRCAAGGGQGQPNGNDARLPSGRPPVHPAGNLGKTGKTVIDIKPTIHEKMIRNASLHSLAEHEKQQDRYFAASASSVDEKSGEMNEEFSMQTPLQQTTKFPESPFGADDSKVQDQDCKKDVEDDAPATMDDLLLDASVVADQNAKLSVFCMRPSIYAPIPNFLAETITTCFLVLGIFMIIQRGEMIHEPGAALYTHGLRALFVGVLIGVLILSLGGIGVAMNPARDLGPRIAHFCLPIAGKGSSEWFYAWIPVFGPFTGAAVAAGLFKAIEFLNKSEASGGFYDDAMEELLNSTG